MKIQLQTSLLAATTVALVAALVGCSIRSAPGVHGRWKPVNSFAEETVAIPLHDTYLFYPSPTDITLKAMLSRWAKDASMTLSYQHPDDFILHTPVAKIRTQDIELAASQLNQVYAGQRVSVVVEGRRITVRLAEPRSGAEAVAGTEPNATN